MAAKSLVATSTCKSASPALAPSGPHRAPSVGNRVNLLERYGYPKKLIHRYIEVFEYPNRRIELRADGSCLKYVRFDELPFIDAGAIVENKRLGHALRVAQVIQAQRDDRRCQGMASRTNSGAKPRPTRPEIGKKRISMFTLDDMTDAVQRRAA